MNETIVSGAQVARFTTDDGTEHTLELREFVNADRHATRSRD